jgi:acetolactate synthase-1/2/3 large subunit
MDVVTMFKAITKWSWSIRNADSIPELIRRAKISLEDKAGAGHLVLPHDIAEEKSDMKPIRTQELSRPKPDHKLGIISQV